MSRDPAVKRPMRTLEVRGVAHSTDTYRYRLILYAHPPLENMYDYEENLYLDDKIYRKGGRPFHGSIFRCRSLSMGTTSVHNFGCLFVLRQERRSSARPGSFRPREGAVAPSLAFKYSALQYIHSVTALLALRTRDNLYLEKRRSPLRWRTHITR